MSLKLQDVILKVNDLKIGESLCLNLDDDEHLLLVTEFKNLYKDTVSIQFICYDSISNGRSLYEIKKSE